MKSLIRLLDSINKTFWISTLSTLTLLSLVLMGLLGLDTSSIRIPDLIFNYNESYVGLFLSVIGPEGRNSYKTTASIDLVYMFLYTGLFILVNFSIYRRRVLKPALLLTVTLLPLVILVMDLIETGGMLYSLQIHPAVSFSLSSLISKASTLKWSFVGVEVFVLLFGFALKKK